MDKNKKYLVLMLCFFFVVIGLSIPYVMKAQIDDKQEMEMMKLQVDSLRYDLRVLQERQLELDREYVEHLDSLYLKINELKK